MSIHWWEVVGGLIIRRIRMRAKNHLGGKELFWFRNEENESANPARSDRGRDHVILNVLGNDKAIFQNFPSLRYILTYRSSISMPNSLTSQSCAAVSAFYLEIIYSNATLFQLRDGAQIPIIGFGRSCILSNRFVHHRNIGSGTYELDSEDAYNAVTWALEVTLIS